jgi:hypothetical protein
VVVELQKTKFLRERLKLPAVVGAAGIKLWF